MKIVNKLRKNYASCEKYIKWLRKITGNCHIINQQLCYRVQSSMLQFFWEIEKLIYVFLAIVDLNGWMIEILMSNSHWVMRIWPNLNVKLLITGAYPMLWRNKVESTWKCGYRVKSRQICRFFGYTLVKFKIMAGTNLSNWLLGLVAW